MGKETGIQYAGSTQNFWQGCRKVSPGCRNCYMFRDMERWGKDPRQVVRSKHTTFFAPHKWADGRVVFTCSWSDFFIEEADPWRDDAWQVIRDTPQHFYQIFTKRIERVAGCLPGDWANGYANVAIIFTGENQEWYDRRVQYLDDFAAVIKGVSMEPLLGPVDLRIGQVPRYDWVMVGGESGHGQVPEDPGVRYGYRVCDESWIADIVQQCQQAGVSVFVKQLGTHLAKLRGMSDWHGGKQSEFPAHLQVFELPEYINEYLNQSKHSDGIA